MILKKVNINNLLKLITYIFALPIVILIRILSPFILIRWFCTQSTRIGHYCENLQIYIAMKEKKLIFQSTRKHIDIFYDRTTVCNNQLKKMWKRSKNLFFLPNWLMDPINNVNEYIVDKIIPSKNLHDIGYYYVPGKLIPEFAVPINHMDRYNAINDSKSPVYFNSSEKDKGNKILKELGINDEERFVILALRDESYLKKNYPKINWDRHSNRFTDIKYFNKSIDYLNKKKIKVILIGSGANSVLNIKNENLINYENSKFKSDFMDIYLFSVKECKFVISSVTGIDAVGTLFKKPVLEIGIWPFACARVYSHTYNYIFKKYFSKSLNRFLTMKEIFELNLADYSDNMDDNNSELEIIHPNESEILNSTIEFFEKIENIYVSNSQGKELQIEFEKKFKNYIDRYCPRFTVEKQFGKITESYILMNKYLLN